MPKKYKVFKKTSQQKANKKAKKQKKKTNPTIVNRNVVNIRTDQTPSSGARIPITLRDVYDTTPRIERPQESTFAVLENQSKQLELFKTNLLQQNQANFKTLTESVAHDIDVLNGDIQAQNNNLLTQYEDNLALTNDLQVQYEDYKKSTNDYTVQSNDVKQLKMLANTFIKQTQKPKETNKIFDAESKPKEADKIFNQPTLPPPQALPVIEEEYEDVTDDKPVDKKEAIKPAPKIKKTKIICDECGESFKSASGLSSHKKKHARELADSKGYKL
jgi:hypothetical protein